VLGQPLARRFDNRATRFSASRSQWLAVSCIRAANPIFPPGRPIICSASLLSTPSPRLTTFVFNLPQASRWPDRYSLGTFVMQGEIADTMHHPAVSAR
jgi:hypothetical protein